MVRKFTKSKSIFPTDDAIRKVVYMSVSEISKKWTMPVRDWGLAYAQFMIYFEDRFAAQDQLGALPRTPEFIRWKIPVKQKSSELAPLLFTVYLAAASGRSPALPCFAAFLALVRFSGLFAFTQLFFQTLAQLCDLILLTLTTSQRSCTTLFLGFCAAELISRTRREHYLRI